MGKKTGRKPFSDDMNFERIMVTDTCWIWMGPRKGGGYGIKGRVGGGKAQVAHRWMYEMFVGPIPDGLYVLHKCDYPPCCNPDHLYLGTNAENMRDMSERMRQPGSTLTKAQVFAIRADTRSNRIVGLDYNVSSSTVGRIRLGRTYRHVV